jgi:hypothetical protein
MLKRFSHFFACLLLVLMPLQGFAAASMFVCNSMMQVEANSIKQMQNMPCHKHMASVINTKDSCKHKNTCKTNCATLCASLSGLTALPSDLRPVPLRATSNALDCYTQAYVSITLPNLQRPPISFI